MTKPGEIGAEAIRAARAAYMREFRKRRPDVYANERRRGAAAGRARRRLAARYPDEYTALYIEELEAEDLS
jgi:hypothetical protein